MNAQQAGAKVTSLSRFRTFDSRRMKFMERRRSRSILIVVLAFGLFQACSAFKDDKCNECPKWEVSAKERVIGE